FALPVKSFRRFMLGASSAVGLDRRKGAGAAGLEPADGGSKGRCLTNLATPQQSPECGAPRRLRGAAPPSGGAYRDSPGAAPQAPPRPGSAKPAAARAAAARSANTP